MLLRIRTLITSLTTFLIPFTARADLPDMEDPSRGKGDGIMETLQNYGYDIVILMSLAIHAVRAGRRSLYVTTQTGPSGYVAVSGDQRLSGAPWFWRSPSDPAKCGLDHPQE